MSGLASLSAPPVVLIADDNGDDVELARIALASSGIALRVEAVPNGRECLAFLRKQGRYAGAPTVDLLLLDINMPVVDGFEVMVEIARDKVLHELPVIVLTTSAAEADIRRMYALRCSAYVTKSLEFEAFKHSLQALVQFWLAVAVLPTRIP